MNIKTIVTAAVKEYEAKHDIKSAKKLFTIDQAPNANNTSYKILVTSKEDVMVQGAEDVAKNLYNVQNSLKNSLSMNGLPSTIENVNSDSFRITVDTTSLKESTVRLLNGLKDGSKTILGLTEATIQIIISDIDGLEDDEMYNSFMGSEYADSYDYNEYEDDMEYEVDQLGTEYDIIDPNDFSEELTEDNEFHDVYMIDSREEEIIPFYAKVVSYSTMNEEPAFFAVNTNEEKLEQTLEELLQILDDSYSDQLDDSELHNTLDLFQAGAVIYTYTDPSNETYFYDDEALATENREADLAAGLDESKDLVIFTEENFKKFSMSCPATLTDLLEVLDTKLCESQSTFSGRFALNGDKPVIVIHESGDCTIHSSSENVEGILTEEEIINNNDIQRLINCVVKGKVFEGKSVLRKIFVNKYNKHEQSVINNLTKSFNKDI
jgi:hypothetical protein